MSANSQKASKPKAAKRTYFGITSLLMAVVSISFLTANFGVSQVNVSVETFTFWNIITAFISCISAPLVLILAFFAWKSDSDSRKLAGTAMILTGIPFLALFIQFAISFIQ